MVTKFDFGFRIIEFEDVRPGDIFFERAELDGIPLGMRIVPPEGPLREKPAILHFQPNRPTAVISTKNVKRDVAVLDAEIRGPALRAENLLYNNSSMREGALMFALGAHFLRVSFDGGTWDVDLTSGEARLTEAIPCPFWVDQWSIVVNREGSSKDIIFQFDGRANRLAG
ncbi:hypothetical protein [Bradyrhizobium sp. AZCC 1721]|uniref:hypothetical protein n=1 Tax=Bradyrhizobium sp. AZCC 1721 TaxID=3117016 RepID=UPI002FEEFE9B